MKSKLKKGILIVVGCIGVGLGAVGAVMPLLPAFPFLLLAAICFGKSSERLNQWFINTKLYKNNLESFVKGQGMTWKTKIRIYYDGSGSGGTDCACLCVGISPVVLHLWCEELQKRRSIKRLLDSPLRG